MRVLVTGGAGFIGSHLCDFLLAADCEVVCMDNLLTGSVDNIAHIRDGRFLFVKHDVTNYIVVDGPVDYVLHLASPASPIDYAELPIPTLKVGALGTHKALGLAKARGAKFLLASTSEVYGDPLVHPQHEEYWGNVNPVGPRGVYDEAKRFAEAMTMAYHRYHGLDTRIVRIFNSTSRSAPSSSTLVKATCTRSPRVTDDESGSPKITVSSGEAPTANPNPFRSVGSGSATTWLSRASCQWSNRTFTRSRPSSISWPLATIGRSGTTW